jgi:hypothetical protein
MGDMVFGNKSGGDNIAGNKYEFHGVPRPAAAAAPEPRDVILLLTANADGHHPLRLDQERRTIDEAVAHSRGASRLDVRSADALRLEDLHTALLRHRPVIAHFSGHGHPTEGIQVVDAAGQPRTVSPTALSDLFRILSAGLRCVVLNACHTDAQAKAIAQHVPCVVGMRRQVLDTTAIMFSGGFYRGIADGRSIRTSFELARNLLLLNGVPDEGVPTLIARAHEADRPVVETV